MQIFVATSYASQVDSSGTVNDQFKAWIEENLAAIESAGHTVYCGLREDNYQINDQPAEAFRTETDHLKSADAVVAILRDTVSSGVQTQIGMANALDKKVFLAHKPEDKLTWFNQSMVEAGVVKELTLPLTSDQLSLLN